MPEVSVIIPSYNHAPYLKQRIDSVLNQSYQDFELIILDDNSSDDSKVILMEYASHPKTTHLVFNPINSGSTFKQWKKGVQLAQGKYIWIAESDDYADKDFLCILMSAFQEHSNLILAYCQSIIVDENDTFIRVMDWADNIDKKRWKQDYVGSAALEVNKYLSLRNTIPNASAVVFRKPIDVNILDESCLINMAGDWVFWRRLLNNDEGKIAFFAKPYNYFREHQLTTRTATNQNKEVNRFKELRQLIVRAKLSPLNNNYDWMVDLWIENRSALKGTNQYFLPNLPRVLFVRLIWILTKMYTKNILRFLGMKF